MWITNAGHANWFFVLAKTDPDAGHAGDWLYCRRKYAGGDSKKEWNMGQRRPTQDVTFLRMLSCLQRIDEQEGDGFKIAMKAFDKTRPAVPGAVGLARSAMDRAVAVCEGASTMVAPSRSIKL